MDRTCLGNGQRQTDYHISLLNINHVGNETKDNPSKDSSTVNATGTGHKA